MMKTGLLFVLLLMLVAPVASRAEFSFLKLESDTALEFVDDMYRDSSGYLWVATAREGLVRFDGYNSRSYRFDDEDESSISSNITTCVLEDRRGEIWVAARNGINRLDRESETFRRYELELDRDRSDASLRVFWMTESASGTLWGLTRRAIHRYDEESDRFLRLDLGELNEAAVDLRHVSEDSEGDLWLLGSAGELFKFEPETGELTHYPNSGVSTEFRGRARMEIDGRYIWVAVDHLGLMRFDKLSGNYRLYPVDSERSGAGTPSSLVFDVESLDEDTLAIAVDLKGICLLDKQSGVFSYFDSFDDGMDGLTTNGVVRLYRDHEGILWVGTSRGGVFFRNPMHVPFMTYRIAGLGGQDFAKSIVGAVFEDSRGLLWVGTDGDGFSIFDLNTGERKAFSTLNSGLSSDVVRRFAEDAQGDVWIATWDGGLNKFDWQSGEVGEASLPLDLGDSIRKQGLWGVTVDHLGRIWLCNDYSIRLLDANLQILGEFLDQRGRVGQRMVYAFDDGAIFASDWNGVYRFDESQREMKQVVRDRKVMQLARGDDGLLYLATLDEGVLVYREDGEPLREIGVSDGLSSTSMRSVELGGDNALWAASDFGLNRIDLDSFSVSRFLEEDGLQGNGYFTQASMALEDGRLAFGGMDGFSLFDPQSVKRSNFDAQVFVRELRVMNKVVQLGNFRSGRSATGENEVSIPWSSKMIGFDFLAVGFTYPNKINYSYKLEGFDEDWIDSAADDRSATYTNLSPGKYRFVVRASLGNGEWSNNMARLDFRIVPPFWMTRWFVSGSVIILMVLAYALLKKREKRLLTEQARLKAQVEERSKLIAEITEAKNKAEESDRLKTQFLANMSHEIRTPMNSIVGFSSLLADPAIEPEDRKAFARQVSSGAESLLKLIDDILDISMIEADQLKIKMEDFSLMNLLEEMHSSFLVHPRAKGVEFVYENEYRRSDVTVHSDRFRMRQILVNLLGNAFKFTTKGKVHLGLEKNSRGLRIYVRDTGEGMSKEEIDTVFERFVKLARHQDLAIRGVGLGLSISKRLSDLIGCELLVDSEKGVGSEFSLLILQSSIRGEIKTEKDEGVGACDYGWSDRTVLVVEDEVSNFLYLKHALEPTRVGIDWAKNGREAVDIIKKKERRYDVVLMDIKMPELDGYSALQQIKDIEPRQVVIAQTAHAMKDDLERIKGAGFDDYLTKPIMRDRLMQTVVKYL